MTEQDIEALKERLRLHDDARLYHEADVLMSAAADALSQLQAENKRLQEELELTDRLYQERDRLLRAIPECEDHGPCLPHAMEWVANVQAENAALRTKLQAITDPENQPNQYGVQVVPVEPTQEMCEAGQHTGKNSAWSYANCYRAMLAAAPKDLLKDD